MKAKLLLILIITCPSSIPLSSPQTENEMWLFRRKGASGFSSSSTAEEVTHGIDDSGFLLPLLQVLYLTFLNITLIYIPFGFHVVRPAYNLSLSNPTFVGLYRICCFVNGKIGY